MKPIHRRAYMALAASMMGPLAGCESIGAPEQNRRQDDPDEAETPAEQGLIRAGSPPRSLISTQNRDIVIPRDYDTIQAAVEDIPLIMRHKYEIEIEPGTYDEDVVVPPFIGEWARPNQQELVPVRITGDQEDPSAVTVNSLFATSALGTIPIQFRGMQIQGSNPFDDEQAGIGIYGCTEVGLIDIEFAGGTNGIVSYNSQVMHRNVNFGDNVLDQNAITVKHGGMAYENPGNSTPTSGTVNGAAYHAKNGNIWFAGSRSTLSGSPLIQTDLGFVYDYDQEATYGPARLSFRNQRVSDRNILANAGLIQLHAGESPRLETIYGGKRGGELTLIANDAIRIESGPGNILLGGGEHMELEPDDTLTLVFDGANWLEKASSKNEPAPGSTPTPTEESTPSPTEDSASPTEDTPSPTEDTPSPTENASSPTENTSSPTDSTPAPTEEF